MSNESKRVQGSTPETTQSSQPVTSQSTISTASQDTPSAARSSGQTDEVRGGNVAEGQSGDVERGDADAEGETELPTAVIQGLEAVIDKFRKRQISKTKAAASVATTIGQVNFSSPEEEDRVFNSYINEMDSFETQFNDQPERAPKRHGDRRRVPDDLDEFFDRVSKAGDHGGEDESGSEEDERPGKRRRLKESDMPWFVRGEARGDVGERSSCRDTCRLLRIYNVDVAKAKFFVSISSRAPDGFPSSQWERIFKGEPVDLNQVLSSLHRVTVDSESTARFGNAKISLGTAEAKRRIQTAADWSAAWRLTSRAIAYAFPHRHSELNAYAEYIEGEFAAKVQSSHPGSSCMTSPSETLLKEDNPCYSQTQANSCGCIPRSSCMTELRLEEVKEMDREWGEVEVDRDEEMGVEAVRFATGSTARSDVRLPKARAGIATSANVAGKPDTTNSTRTYTQILGERPKYLRHNLWSNGESVPSIADWSETAVPLPRPPLSEVENPIVSQTIADHPELFKIVTPIDVDRFEHLLTDHPNQPFVKSVCAGLREGFWPWADTLKEDYPVVYDGHRDPFDPGKAAFIREQCETEVSKGRFSRPFGTSLLPGMYCMPVHAVPKPGSSDLRMVTDHSAGPFSLNSMIDHSKVTGYPLDNMKLIGEMLLKIREEDRDRELVMWKSDIAEAYRLMPVHPLWQIKQINFVDGQAYLRVHLQAERNLAFGSSASPAIFIAFNSLTTWIAKHKMGIGYIGTYVDDSAGVETKGEMVKYEPYGKELPRSQARLLELWDDLRIPHKEKKQLWGSPLTIIGIDVNPNSMTLSLSQKSRDDLVDALHSWAVKPVKGRKASYQLKHWQRMAGWFNWSLNAFPLLRPALNNVYDKISGDYDPKRRLARAWEVHDAEWVIYCDACPKGMGFVYEKSNEAFHCDSIADFVAPIFYFEALCVLSALLNVSKRAQRGDRVVIYTDNMNTVQIFNSLSALPEFNDLLKAAVDVMILCDIKVRVLHIPGELNTIADTLSRSAFITALDCNPSVRARQPKRSPWSAERLVRERAIALAAFIDKSTSDGYGSALNSYLEFVKIHERPVDPTADTLSFYVVFMSHHIEPKSVGTYLELEPYFPEIRETRNSLLVRRTLRGCKRLYSQPTKRKHPLTLADLQRVIEHYHDSKDHDDLLF
ncbi:hypothetical protein CVT26_000980, partial [Gymnopilus dilepis]